MTADRRPPAPRAGHLGAGRLQPRPGRAPAARSATAVLALVAVLAAVAAFAQSAAPPAEYRPPAPRAAPPAPALLLPKDAPARGIALPEPTAAEIAAGRQRARNAPSRQGLTLKGSRLLAGFARTVPAPERAIALAELDWRVVADGTRAAQVTLRSPGAAALRVAVVLADAPPALVVRFQGSAAGAPTYAATAAEVAADRPYWSPVLDGDTATLELALPPGAAPGAARIELPLLSHLKATIGSLKYNSYVDPYVGQAGACEVDVACLDAALQAQARTAVNAVARMVVTYSGETWFCTGTVVNDTATSFVPYLLTANHCLEDDDPGDPAQPGDYDPARAADGRGSAAAAASSFNTYWQFLAAACGSLALPPYVLLPGGAKLLARSADYDWALVRLNLAPPAGTTYAAWNAAGPLAAATAVATIHHPEADLKKVSQGSVQGYFPFSDGSSFVQARWTRGVTEPGSSGAGLFTLNAAGGYYEVRGTLWAGESDCASPSGYDYYSRLDVAYPLIAQYLAPTASNPAKTAPAVEYYLAASDAYHLTADPAEIAAYDAGAPAGRVRTGYRFLAWTDPATAPAGAQPVCRLYAPPPHGDTRFYSASAAECASLLANPSLHFVEESAAAFYALLPNAAGACPDGTRAVYRFLDASGTPRRRYTAEVNLRDSLIATGSWTQEGEGTAPDKVALCAPATGAALPLTPSTNFQGLWWNAAESGWGISFAHQGDVIFATWYTYDRSGQPRWLVAKLDKDPSDAGLYTGLVSTVTGPPFDAQPFDRNAAFPTTVGSATLAFTDVDGGRFTYSVDGVTQTKAISRQVFGTVPTCTWGAQPDLRLATNYTDLWWVAGGVESGWGASFMHQSDVVFVTWYTYDRKGRPWWLVAIARQDPARSNVYSGDVWTATGPPFGAPAFDPGSVVPAIVGSATLTFANGNSATFAWEVDGVARVKAMEREVFAPPGTVCN